MWLVYYYISFRLNDSATFIFQSCITETRLIYNLFYSQKILRNENIQYHNL